MSSIIISPKGEASAFYEIKNSLFRFNNCSTTLKTIKVMGFCFGLGCSIASSAFSFNRTDLSMILKIGGGCALFASFVFSFFLFSKKSVNYSQQRKIPPISPSDTIILCDGKIRSVYGFGSLFKDELIIEKLNIQKKEQVDEDVFVEYTLHGKAIIQQQATRGCTAAASAMLIMDHGKKPNIFELRKCNLGDFPDMIRDIKKAGLSESLSQVNNISELRELLIKNGSAIVSIDDRSLGNHVIVVDDISKDLSLVRLRDPYHGWEITIATSSFERTHPYFEPILQITGEKSK